MRAQYVSLIVGGLMVVGLGIFLIWRGLPLLLGGVVRMVPVAWEERLGRTIQEGMAKPGNTCEDPATKALMAAIVERLEAAMPKSPYRYDVKVVRSPEVNAMAAPGGHIVVFSGLIQRMDNPEQVAAVLAHEMQHVAQRHAMKGLARALGIQIVLSMIVGDPGMLGDLAGNLGTLHFMRSDEESADDGALETLERAGIAPVEMERAFENLEKSGKRRESAEPFKYVSTHPPLKERIARVRERGAAWKGTVRPLPATLAGACKV